MGATDCYMGLKGKTREALTKDFWKKVKAAQHEHGHGGYSGTAAEFSQLVFTTKVFNNWEEMQAFIEDKDKNVAYVAQMKVIKDSPTIERWLAEAKANSDQWYRSQDDKTRKCLSKQLDALHAKISKARKRKSEASKKTEWLACGLVSI